MFPNWYTAPEMTRWWKKVWYGRKKYTSSFEIPEKLCISSQNIRFVWRKTFDYFSELF